MRAAVVIGIVISVVVGAEGRAERSSVRWYLVHQALNDRDASLNLGDALHDVVLKGGWSCSVGPTSKQLPAYEARQTTCRNAEKSFQFSVQCESQRPKDHTQIRFNDASGRSVDFIEVGCELTE